MSEDRYKLAQELYNDGKVIKAFEVMIGEKFDSGSEKWQSVIMCYLRSGRCHPELFLKNLYNPPENRKG
jgi:hypothetical protein